MPLSGCWQILTCRVRCSSVNTGQPFSHDWAKAVHSAEPRLEDLDRDYESRCRERCMERHFWRTLIAGIRGALNVFVNVARIRSDAFWFSAVR